MTVYPRYGKYVRTPRLHGPGLVLSGRRRRRSSERRLCVDAAHDRRNGRRYAPVTSSCCARASANEYDTFFYSYGHFSSVQTVLIPPCAARAISIGPRTIVDGADAVFFAGGDQAHYVVWKGSALIAAVKRVYARGGIVGGGSAGLRDSRRGRLRFGRRRPAERRRAHARRRRQSVRTAHQLHHRIIRVAAAARHDHRHAFRRTQSLRTHGRLSRTYLDRRADAGRRRRSTRLGIDQASAVVVDARGVATVINATGGRGAYLVRAPGNAKIRSGVPFVYRVEVSHVRRNFETFNLAAKTTSDPWSEVRVNASATMYSRDPYDL